MRLASIACSTRLKFGQKPNHPNKGHVKLCIFHVMIIIPFIRGFKVLLSEPRRNAMKIIQLAKRIGSEDGNSTFYGKKHTIKVIHDTMMSCLNNTVWAGVAKEAGVKKAKKIKKQMVTLLHYKSLNRLYCSYSRFRWHIYTVTYQNVVDGSHLRF